MFENSEWVIQEHGATYGQPLRQRTKDYALRVIRLYGTLPHSVEAQVIGKQLLRSGTSVGANDREGSRARSSAEMLTKFGLCIRELEESAYWIELLLDAQIMPATVLEPLVDETKQLVAIFTASIKRIKQQ